MSVCSCPAGVLPAVISLTQSRVVSTGAACAADAEILEFCFELKDVEMFFYAGNISRYFHSDTLSCLSNSALSVLPRRHHRLFVLVLFWHVLFTNIYSQSALSTISCSPQLLSSRSSWPWWLSVTPQSPSAQREKSPTRLHLQVERTFRQLECLDTKCTMCL